MKTTRRQLLQTAAVAAPAILRAQRTRRNVLVIVADDQGLDLGCYGNRVVQTPNLDKLAAEGVRFTNAFCTTASCSASRSVILTGLHNHANGQYGHAHLPHNFNELPHVRSLPRLLGDADYATGVIGKLHVAPPSLFPFEVNHEGNPRDIAGMVRKAGDLFRQPRPFYLHIGFGDPHRAGRGFANDRDYPGVKHVTYDPAKIEVPYFLPDQPEVRAELAEYYQAISRLDQGVGQLLDELRKSGQAENTLVLYLSDNGMPFPGAKASQYEPGVHLPLIVRSPATSRRGAVNNAMVTWTDLVPTCLDWAGAKPPDYALHGRSLLPILDQENPAGWDEVFLSHTFHEVINYYPVRVARMRRHKYIRNIAHDILYPLPSDLLASRTWQGVLKRMKASPTGPASEKDKMYGKRTVQAFLRRPAEELYDLEKDPHEARNVAGSAEYGDVLATLRGKTDEFQQRTKDPWWEYLQQRRVMPGV